jgi:type IV pilus assembly protein PilF
MYIICIGFLLAACDQTYTRQSVSPSTGSNAVAEANLNLGIEYMKRGNYDKALQKLKKAEAADPGYAPVQNALGLLYQRLGELEQAEQYFKHALSLSPNDSSTLNNYGLFLCQNNRYEEAQETLLKAANNPLYETPEVALTNAGTCALTAGRTDIAEGYFRDALKRNPRIPTALVQMAEISYKQGKHLQTRGYLQRYLAVAKHTPKTLWMGINIEQILGDKNALSSYKLLLRNKFPNSKEARMLQDSGEN